MKKLVLISFLSLILSGLFAQSTTPRFGTPPYRNNTGSGLTYQVKTLTHYANNDSMKIYPSAYCTYTYTAHTITHSVRYYIYGTNSFLGDQLSVMVSNSSGMGHKLKFYGDIQLGTSTTYVTLPSASRFIINFTFDGTKFVEISRSTGATGLTGATGPTGATGATGAP